MRAGLRIVAPTTEKRTVPGPGSTALPTRQANAVYRTREHLTETEVERLLKAAGKNRWGHRDATMILVAYRHGLRASEIVDLRWDQIDFANARLHVRRVKRGTPATHPVVGDELRALRKLQREQEPASPFVFTSERGAPFSTSGFAKLVERADEVAKLGFPATLTCCDTAAALHWQTRGTIQGRYKPISATRISSTRYATPSSHRPGSRISGGDGHDHARRHRPQARRSRPAH